MPDSKSASFESDLHGNPLRGVMIEIWQADHNGHYIHSADAGVCRDKASNDT